MISQAAPAPDPAPEAGRGQPLVLLPAPVPDPIEPVNRVVWAFNRGLMIGVIQPTAKAYRFVIRKPLRLGIQNFGRNITYPGRLVNNLLQGEWAGARDESYRFGCNTVFGLAGFFDVASRLDIPKSEADFGGTFGHWGWKPNSFIMLPFFGPSNDRDALGRAADIAANPLTYFSPYRFDGSNPLTYFGPYSYASHAVTYNDLSDSVDRFVRFSRTQKDVYAELAYTWGFLRESRAADFRVTGPPDPASLETLQSVFISVKDPEFPGRGKTRSVLIPATGKKLKFSLWLRPGSAPVAYIVPGLGSHRLADTALALAELLYENGFSAVCVSSPFNYEFMENASTAALPACTAIDACDLQSALSEIHRQLEGAFPDRLTAKALIGYSMGGFHSLFLAADGCQNDAPPIRFDRYVALNPPVRLLYGTAKLDEFFQAPLEWPAEERAGNIENTFFKIAALTQNPVAPPTTPLFSGIESRFLVGAAFRLILRDIIFSSQERNDQGVLQNPVTGWRRGPVYQEILRYSFSDYFAEFAVPYYRGRAPNLNVPEVLARTGDLRNYTAGLLAHASVRVIGNRNDFLLADSDVAWLESTLPPDRLTLFEKGGHLGNFSDPDLQQAILDALAGLAGAPEEP